MLLKTIYGEAEADPGTWFTWQEDKETREKVEFLVRHLPPSERKRINLKHFGKKRRLRFGEHVEQELDPVANAEATREMAAYCLLDSRGFTFLAGPQLAERLSVLLSEKVGPQVTLDGRWSDQVKDEMLRSAAGGEIMAFIDKKATEIIEQKETEEEEASGN